MTAPASSRELVDALLEDEELTPQDLDDFIQRSPEEDLYLDYKDGKLTQDLGKLRRVVREWVSAFANAEGGVLIIGVTETRPRSVSGCHPIGRERLDAWAQKVLSDMIGFFSPQPRFKLVPHPQGEILLVAVARAPQLVPCIESRETKYFLRFHDSTRESPPYLISDLVLGRRRQPTLTPRFEEAGLKLEHDRDAVTSGLLTFNVAVENSSFVVADDLEVGVVGWSLWKSVIAPLGSHLRSHLDIEHPESPVTTDWQLAHRRDKRPELGAFDSISVSLGYFRIPWFRPLNPVDPRRMPPMLYSCGLYLLPRGGSPIWYQMETTIADTAMSWQKFEATFKDSYIALTRLHGSRPLLAWREKA